jgi:anti-sigma factor RsiW
MGHEEIRELLPLAAAGALTAGEQRTLDRHVAECEGCAAELREWGLLTETIEEAPPPPVPEMLLEQTKNRVMAAAAARRERMFTDVILGFLVLFGWTITLVVWFLWRMMSGGGLLDVDLTTVGAWLGGSTVLAWLTAGVAVVALGPRMHAMRRT